MDVPLLRTLAWKSVMKFGKYEDLSVQQIFDLKHTAYLRWVYYHYSNISFTEEILRSIGVVHDKYDHRIKKPGTDFDLCEKVQRINFCAACKLKNASHVVNRINKSKKIRFHKMILSDSKYFSKSRMQQRNQH